MVESIGTFKIKCAGIVVEISYRYESTKEYCKKYIVDDNMPCDIRIIPENKDYEKLKEFLSVHDDDYIELAVLSYMMADALIACGCAVIHGAAISYDGEGIIFTAKSGTGKSTHISLWKKVFGSKVSAVNGDKPILSAVGDKMFVSGSPFCGKEGLSSNVTVPLKAICFIERGEENSIKKLSSNEVLSKIFEQLFIPRVGSELMGKAMAFTDILIRGTEFYLLKCNMTDEAPKVAYNGIFKD